MSHAFYTTHKDKDRTKHWYYDGHTTPDILKLLWQGHERFDPATDRRFVVFSRITNWNMEVHIDYFMPTDAPAGRYRVEMFIPGEQADTTMAIYQLAHNVRQENGESVFDTHVWVVPQFRYSDTWVSVGEFDFDPEAHPVSGRLRLVDMTREDPPKTIAFGPVRWIPLSDLPHDAQLFDPPMGTDVERDGAFREDFFAGAYPYWVGNWFDFNTFLNWYSLGFHTGADLNLPGTGTVDAGKPIHAVSNGKVTFAGEHRDWGHLIVIEHAEAQVIMPDGSAERRVVHSRYGHMQSNLKVNTNDLVTRGQEIGFIGLKDPNFHNWHLHFDISHSGILKDKHWHWPDLRRIRHLQSLGMSESHPTFLQAKSDVQREVIANYVEPLAFLKLNHGETD